MWVNLKHQLDHCDHRPTSYRLLETGTIDLKYKDNYKLNLLHLKWQKKGKQTDAKCPGLDTKLTCHRHDWEYRQESSKVLEKRLE